MIIIKLRIPVSDNQLILKIKRFQFMQNIDLNTTKTWKMDSQSLTIKYQVLMLPLNIKCLCFMEEVLTRYILTMVVIFSNKSQCYGLEILPVSNYKSLSKKKKKNP